MAGYPAVMVFGHGIWILDRCAYGSYVVEQNGRIADIVGTAFGVYLQIQVVPASVAQDAECSQVAYVVAEIVEVVECRHVRKLYPVVVYDVFEIFVAPFNIIFTCMN